MSLSTLSTLLPYWFSAQASLDLYVGQTALLPYQLSAGQNSYFVYWLSARPELPVGLGLTKRPYWFYASLTVLLLYCVGA